MSYLQEYRKKRELSQSGLAEKSGVSIRNIQFYEQEKMNIDGARISTLLALATALGCRISDIIQDGELKKLLAERGY